MKSDSGVATVRLTVPLRGRRRGTGSCSEYEALVEVMVGRFAAWIVPITAALACGAPRTAAIGPPDSVSREITVTSEWSLWSSESAEQLRLVERSNHEVVGELTVRKRWITPSEPDSIAAFVDSLIRARFARLGCSSPVRGTRGITCVVRFRAGTPDWAAAVRMVDAAVAADATPEAVIAPMPNGTIRIRGCNDYCPRITVSIHRTDTILERRLGIDASRRVERLIDSLQTIAERVAP